MPQLKPFQQEGAAFLAERTRALLADEPGVGKTAQVVAACDIVGAQKVQIICPSIATEHWMREFVKWSPRRYEVRANSWDRAHDLAKAFGKPRRLWDVLVADECHFGKNPQARRTKAVFGTGGLGWYAKRIWALSGTPAPNNASELWPLLRAFGKTPMDFETFKRYFCEVDMAGKVRRNRADHVEELRTLLKQFSLRRLKKDVLSELGEIDVQEWYVKPDLRFAVEVASGLQEAMFMEAVRGKSDDEIMALLSDPHEDFSTLRRWNALLKAPAVFDTVKFELETGLLDKVVIYGYHKEALAALHREFGSCGIGSVLINGDTPMHERDALVQRWKSDAGTPVFIGSLVVASTAIDLTAAHQGILLEVDWVPGVNAQAIQRMHRHGQDKPVTVRVAMGTPVDEIVTGVVLRKTKDIAEIFS